MSRYPSTQRDPGMTLPEVLISVVVIGLLATVLGAAITTVLRTERGAEGRLNVARAEQNVALWLPADLSSATDAADEPGLSPCGAPSCPGVGALGGSNALMLTWPEPPDTSVAYIYRPAADGVTYEIARVECPGGPCSSVVVLRDLAGPPHSEFVPGVTEVPPSVFDVTVPLAADAVDDDDTTDEDDPAKPANRVVVSIDGGGGSQGAGGGANRISITAGGTQLETLEAAKPTGPGFLQARSRCGGPITLVVDESNSIGSAIGDVRDGVDDFVAALAGTPTQLQIVRMKTASGVLGSSDRSRYFDMASDGEVNEIRAAIPQLQGSWAGTLGGTNWEDALFRTFYDESGARYDQDGNPTTPVPGLVVFFTDGVPTFDRLDSATGTGPLLAEPPALPTPPWPSSNGYQYSQVAWNRADHIAREFRSSVRLVGVGVGADIDEQSYTFDDPGNGIRYLEGTGRTSIQRRRNNGNWQALPQNVYNAGLTDNSKVLGNLIVGGSVTNPDDEGWVESYYDSGTGTWVNADIADLFLTPDWARFSDALVSIALGECGGTLTLQTQLSNGSPAQADVTYESGGETITTSRVAKAATFDLTIPSGTALEATVTPQTLSSTGYSAQGWTCRSRGADLPSSEWELVTPGSPGDGIRVDVRANQAVSCTMTVS